MIFTINKPSDITTTLAKVSRTIKNNGGNFLGNENFGRFSGNGVEGQYNIMGEHIKVSIIKKPFFAPDSLIEKKISEYFHGA